MPLNLDDRKKAFIDLGKLLEDFLNKKLNNTKKEKFLNEKIDSAHRQNPWFDKKNILHAFSGISYMLKKEKIDKWLARYEQEIQKPLSPNNIAVIMAGNLPLVNFHDFLCVLITGHNFIGKLSSNDQILPVALADLLIDIEPSFKNKIHFTTERISDFNAVIATGSDNSARYFEYYFGKYPHIIRKNRNSIAILDGNEDMASLQALSEDIFRYYGMGCRNISKLLVPKDYSFINFFKSIESWKEILDFHKYRNNYDYYKAMLLVNKTEHLDNGFLLLKEDENLSSPLSVLFYQQYYAKEEINDYINTNKHSIQCIVSSPANISDYHTISGIVPFGKSQYPELWDYADGIDTINFLLNTL